MTKRNSMPIDKISSEPSSELNVDPTFLIDTAKELTEAFNKISETIQQLEDGLRSLNANFPFRKTIETGPESLTKKPKGYHKAYSFEVLEYTTRNEWSISWEKDPVSKEGKYRFFIIQVEKDILYYTYGYDEPMLKTKESNKEKVVFKKPLRQSKIAVRARFSKYLKSFIDDFEAELRQYCISLKEGTLPL